MLLALLVLEYTPVIISISSCIIDIYSYCGKTLDHPSIHPFAVFPSGACISLSHNVVQCRLLIAYSDGSNNKFSNFIQSDVGNIK